MASIASLVRALCGQIQCDYFDWLNRGALPASAVAEIEPPKRSEFRAC